MRPSLLIVKQGKPAISLQFTKEGGDKFAEITGRNVGKQLPIVLDNVVVSAPNVQEQITGGNAQITGNFTVDEAKQLAVQLNAGLFRFRSTWFRKLQLVQLLAHFP